MVLVACLTARSYFRPINLVLTLLLSLHHLLLQLIGVLRVGTTLIAVKVDILWGDHLLCLCCLVAMTRILELVNHILLVCCLLLLPYHLIQSKVNLLLLMLLTFTRRQHLHIPVAALTRQWIDFDLSIHELLLRQDTVVGRGFPLWCLRFWGYVMWWFFDSASSVLRLGRCFCLATCFQSPVQIARPIEISPQHRQLIWLILAWRMFTRFRLLWRCWDGGVIGCLLLILVGLFGRFRLL